MNLLDKMLKRTTKESIITKDGRKITSWKDGKGYYHQEDITSNTYNDIPIIKATYNDYIEYLISAGYKWNRKILTIEDAKIENNKIIFKSKSGIFSIRGNLQLPIGYGYIIKCELFDNKNKELDNNAMINIMFYGRNRPEPYDISGKDNKYTYFSSGLFKFNDGMELTEKTSLVFEIQDDSFVIDKEKSKIFIECDEFQKIDKK